IFIEIGRVHSHPGARSSLGAVADVCLQSHLFEASAALIHKQEIGYGVIGDEEIHAAIVVDVRGNDAPGFAEMLRYSGLLTHVGESSVAIVVEQPTRHRFEDSRNAIVTFTIFGYATTGGLIELSKLTDE